MAAFAFARMTRRKKPRADGKPAAQAVGSLPGLRRHKDPDMTDTPQDTPQDDRSPAVDDVAAEATTTKESPQERTEEAESSAGKKPWWKFWA
jgi:hypothetical protein